MLQFGFGHRFVTTIVADISARRRNVDLLRSCALPRDPEIVALF